jgi:hypothetical protein
LGGTILPNFAVFPDPLQYQGIYTTSVGVPATYRFKATGGVRPYKITWSFSDGSPDEVTWNEEVIHTFTQNGLQTVTAAVLDTAEDTFQTSRDIYVYDASIVVADSSSFESKVTLLPDGRESLNPADVQVWTYTSDVCPPGAPETTCIYKAGSLPDPVEIEYNGSSASEYDGNPYPRYPATITTIFWSPQYQRQFDRIFKAVRNYWEYYYTVSPGGQTIGWFNTQMQDKSFQYSHQIPQNFTRPSLIGLHSWDKGVPDSADDWMDITREEPNEGKVSHVVRSAWDYSNEGLDGFGDPNPETDTGGRGGKYLGQLLHQDPDNAALTTTGDTSAQLFFGWTAGLPLEPLDTVYFTVRREITDATGKPVSREDLFKLSSPNRVFGYATCDSNPMVGHSIELEINDYAWSDTTTTDVNGFYEFFDPPSSNPNEAHVSDQDDCDGCTEGCENWGTHTAPGETQIDIDAAGGV